MFKEMMENVRRETPLIHNITNYVTVNDCANVILAVGASPIMADEVDEVEDIVSISKALVINTGTINREKFGSMLLAGKKANQLKIPVVLDPVGVGASSFRTKSIRKLMEEIDFQVIRANASEIKAIALGLTIPKGADANTEDVVNNENIGEYSGLIKNLSRKTGCVVAMTGKIDLVGDKDDIYLIKNGHELMTKVTGVGCQLSALTGAFISVNRENIARSVTAAVATMGLCGEIAKKRMTPLDGNSSYRNYIIDAIFNLSPGDLDKGVDYEIL